VRHGRTRILANTHEIPVAESLRNPDAELKVDLLLEKMRFVAGDAQVETFDAQTLAEEFLGDTLASNILATGYAWQRGLIPLGLEALTRAIELNGVAVASNQMAFSLGRLAAGQPQAIEALRDAPVAEPQDDAPEALIARAVRHLAAYQDVAWAQRFETRLRAVQQREAALAGGDPSLPLTRNAARSLQKLMSYKDEYEVARLYSDGSFRASLSEQFEGDVKLEFHMAPPFLARPKNGQPPVKIRLGGWMLPAMKYLAYGKRLRGTVFDLFGHTEERRLERSLIDQFDARLDELLAELSPANQKLAAQIAALPMTIRGYGHVKLANLALARGREAELLHRFAPKRYPRPAFEAKAGQIRGIAVVAS
jgi:indolepyruvate ferredoxin oxidoreductase